MSPANLLPLKTIIPLVLAVLGWFLAFIGVCVRQADWDNSKRGLRIDRNPVAVAWFSIFLNIFIILGLSGTIFTNTLHQYRMALLAFIAISVGVIIPDINVTLYSPLVALGVSDAGYGLSSAGFIILILALFYFIVYIGSEQESQVHLGLDSLGSLSSQIPDAPGSNKSSGLRASDYQPPLHPTQKKTFSVVSKNTAVQMPPPQGPTPGIPVNKSSPAPSPAAQVSVITATSLYSYTRNPDDPHEISFEKGEKFEVLDNKGKWWKIKKASGEVGIAPSNYLKVAA